MNSINGWCRNLSLICCLILGIEGLMFGHNVAIQAQKVENPALAQNDAAHLKGKHRFDFLSPKLAAN